MQFLSAVVFIGDVKRLGRGPKDGEERGSMISDEEQSEKKTIQKEVIFQKSMISIKRDMSRPEHTYTHTHIRRVNNEIT
jgi:hypothetical protein